jgi:GNAT superfamily N-acetyltransferase
LASFLSGEPTLDDWLRSRALDNGYLGASKTYVACEAGSGRVVGYYALSMGQILNSEATGPMRRNMPRQIPAVMLGRLAVDRNWHGRGLGGALLQDAVRRSERAAQEVAARLLIVHAISPAAETFYRHYGFTRLPVDTPTYALDFAKLSRAEMRV